MDTSANWAKALVARRTALHALWVGVVGFALAGCGGSVESDLAAQARQGDDKGYIAGDGTVQQIARPDRQSEITLTGTTLEGEPWSSLDARGEVVVINVWGSWCGPCIEELPDLEKAFEATTGDAKPVKFIGVNRRDGAATALAFQENRDVPYPSLQDDGGQTQLDLKGLANATPTTLVLDKDGFVAGRVSGQVEASVLIAMVMDVVNES